ncbi:10837_t:CDS:2, partial [Gigaspora rosea]
KTYFTTGIYFISDAWSEVSNTTIRNCWKATGIMLEVSENFRSHELISNIEKYTDLIDQPAATKDILMDIGIIEMVNYEFDEEDKETKDNDKEDSPPPQITITKAMEALEKIIRYQESLEVEKG